MESKELAVIVESSGIEKTKAQTVLDSFSNFFEQASEWEQKTKGLVITDVSQVAEMEMAREGRLQLKEIRVNAEKARKKLKENILLEGRFIDSIYNLIEGVTKPIESDLLEKEKFVERIEQAKKDAIRDDRIAKLSPYNVDHAFYDLYNMPEESFLQLLDNSRISFEQKIEAQRKLEDDRIAKEKADQEERARIEKDNKRLREESRLSAIEAEKEKAKQESERKEREAKEKAERERQEALIRQANAETERVKEELAAKQESERKEREAIAAAQEKERKELAEKARQLELAGDREKVLAYIMAIENIGIPETKSIEAKKLISGIVTFLATAKASASTDL